MRSASAAASGWKLLRLSRLKWARSTTTGPGRSSASVWASRVLMASGVTVGMGVTAMLVGGTSGGV